jgi:hypothetical protein
VLHRSPWRQATCLGKVSCVLAAGNLTITDSWTYLDTTQTEIQLHVNVLTIKVAIKQEGEREGQNSRGYQRFGWTVMLPGDVALSSKHANDMLEVHMAFLPLVQDSQGNSVAFRGNAPTDSQGNPVPPRAAPGDSQRKPEKIETPTTAGQ